jgi:hypothetical protein
VGADTFEQDRLLALVLHELKDDAQFVTGTAYPRAVELSFEFVGSELGMKSVFRQQGQRGLQLGPNLWMLAGKPPTGTNECCGRQEPPLQAKRRLMI